MNIVYSPFEKNVQEQNFDEMSSDPVAVAYIDHGYLSAVFQDILTQNDIPYMVRQYDASIYSNPTGETEKSQDSVFVMSEDFYIALDLYNEFIKEQDQIENDQSN